MRNTVIRDESLVRPYETEEWKAVPPEKVSKLASVQDIINSRKKLNIDRFLSLIYYVLKESNMLKDMPDVDVVNKSRFYFTHMYPDIPEGTETDNIITYEILKRSPATLESKAVSSKRFIQRSPTYMGTTKDHMDGGLVDYYLSTYDNEVQFTIWSQKAEDAYRLSSMLENFFIKYYNIFRVYIGANHYVGRKATIVSSDYGSKRLFGVPIVYLFRTEEPSFIRQSEIVSIDVVEQVIKSFP